MKVDIFLKKINNNIQIIMKNCFGSKMFIMLTFEEVG